MTRSTGLSGFFKKVFSIFLLLYLLFTAAAFSLAAEKQVTKRVLVIYSYHEGLPWERIIDDSLRAMLVSKSTEPIELNVEHADRIRYPGDAYLQKFVDLCRRKYSNPKMDVVISIDDEATDILLEHGEELFPGVPIVLVTAQRKTLQRDSLKPNMTSLLWGVDIRGTLDLICQILPKTRQIFIITGSSLSDRAVQKMAREALRGYTKRVEINYLAEITQKNLMDKVEQLPEHAVLLYLAFSRDSEGRSFVPREIMFDISQKTNVPMFGIVDTYLGFGIVGGHMLSAELQGKRCAEICLRILNGEFPTDITPERTHNITMFDERQLKRWGINEEKLPPDSIVRYREFSIWRQYRWQSIGLILIGLTQSLIVILLWIQWRKRKNAEERIHESEVKYQTVADYTYDWEYWANFDGTLHYVSPSCERISSYTDQEFIDNPSLFREIIVPEDRGLWDEHYCNSRDELTERELEFRIQRRGGEIRWIEHACQPVYDDQGNSLGFRASNRDITERKQMEKKSQSLQEELSHVLRVLSIGEIAASLAHEINQPLTAIRSYAQAAQRLLVNDTPDLDKVGKTLEGIVAGNRRAEEVIQRIRMVIKNEPLERSRLDVKKFIKEVVSFVRKSVEEHKISLRLDLDAELPQVFGDRVQLQQVVLNLIINGLDAINAAGEDGFRELFVSASKDEPDVVTISVRDSGMGIDEKNEDRIFDSFFSTKFQGLGMGLSISRSIIEEHGGRLWAENNPGRGVTFSFMVPIAEQSE